MIKERIRRGLGWGALVLGLGLLALCGAGNVGHPYSGRLADSPPGAWPWQLAQGQEASPGEFPWQLSQGSTNTPGEFPWQLSPIQGSTNTPGEFPWQTG